jgi:hypothetical protein
MTCRKYDDTQRHNRKTDCSGDLLKLDTGMAGTFSSGDRFKE